MKQHVSPKRGNGFSLLDGPGDGQVVIVHLLLDGPGVGQCVIVHPSLPHLHTSLQPPPLAGSVCPSAGAKTDGRSHRRTTLTSAHWHCPAGNPASSSVPCKPAIPPRSRPSPFQPIGQATVTSLQSNSHRLGCPRPAGPIILRWSRPRPSDKLLEASACTEVAISPAIRRGWNELPTIRCSASLPYR